MKVDYSKVAIKDFCAIHDYLINSFGARVAAEKITKLKRDIDYLAKDPFMGKSVDGHDQNLRTLISKPNIILYDVDEYYETVEILHIVDWRRDYGKNDFDSLKRGL